MFGALGKVWKDSFTRGQSIVSENYEFLRNYFLLNYKLLSRVLLRLNIFISINNKDTFTRIILKLNTTETKLTANCREILNTYFEYMNNNCDSNNNGFVE